jgi:hypothetical protein
MKQAVQPCLGSVLRFSQPLNGFLANSSSTALFHAATIPGFLAFRGFPLQRSCTLLRTTGSLVVIHGCAGKHCSKSFALGFRDSRSVGIDRQFPPTTMGSLSANLTPAFRSPWTPLSRISPFPLASSTSKLFPPQVRASRLSKPKPEVDPLLTFCPSRDPLQTSEPPTRSVS